MEHHTSHTDRSLTEKVKARPRRSLLHYAPVLRAPTSSQGISWRELKKELQCGELLAKDLVARGLSSAEEAHRFLSPSLEPFLQRADELKGFDAAAVLIRDAILGQKKIVIACDYDVDGTTSGAILGRAISALGGNVGSYLSPRRGSEGYGLSPSFVQRVREESPQVVIACDFGTGSADALESFRGEGVATLVIDHHEIFDETRTPADAFLSAMQSGCGFREEEPVTAGHAILFVSGLISRLVEDSNLSLRARSEAVRDSGFLRQLSALAGLGTACDVAPLTPFNRALLVQSLEVFSSVGSSARDLLPGLFALRRVSHDPGRITFEDLVFQYGPRVNAASRMVDSDTDLRSGAELPLALFLTDDLEEAEQIARRLTLLNEARKIVEHDATDRAREEVLARPAPQPVTFVHLGVLEGDVAGIVASRLVEEFNAPAFVFTTKNERESRFSARQIKYSRILTGRESEAIPLNLAEIQAAGSDCAVVRDGVAHLGGHAGAAGGTIRAGEEERFVSLVSDEYLRRIGDYDISPFLECTQEVSLSTLKSSEGLRFVSERMRLEPCDTHWNPHPLFRVSNVMITSVLPLGKEREEGTPRHIKLILRQTDRRLNDDVLMRGIIWNCPEDAILDVGQQCTIAGIVSVDSRRRANPTVNDLYLEIKALSIL